MNREFALVTACCLWPPSANRNAIIIGAAAGVDWTRVAKIARRHRVPGLTWNGISQARLDAPPDVTQGLKAGAAATARASLALCAETVRLQRLFDQAGRRCAFIKGSTLALLAYGNIGIRHAKDIDMIVAPSDFASVCDLLTTAGYRPLKQISAMSDGQLALWRSYAKDLEWRHQTSGIALELHWRMTDIAFVFDKGVEDLELYPVEVTSTSRIRTLPPAELFSYLCIHGASHGWCRLKWLADVHALIVDRPALIEDYYNLSKTNATSRAVGQALLLCSDLFALSLPASVRSALRGSHATRILRRLGWLSMTRGGAETEVYDLRFAGTIISVSHLFLATSIRHALAELWRKGLNVDDVLSFPLPNSLSFLYRFLRMPLWIYRRLANAAASRRRPVVAPDMPPPSIATMRPTDRQA